MFNSLSQFYNSKEWRLLRQQLIAERTNDEGFVIDEYNGEKIFKAYDIVAHHEQQLTLDNVNDFNISLNPENIKLVSQRSHNEIHGRFGYASGRKVYYVYGSPCSGKTSFVKNIKGNSDIVLDMDSIWQCITGGNRYDKPNALKTNAFIVRDCIFDMIRTRAGRWERAYVIEGGARKGDRERKIELLGAEPIFIDTDKETCLKRLASDDTRTDKETWAQYVEQWFNDYTE